LKFIGVVVTHLDLHRKRRDLMSLLIHFVVFLSHSSPLSELYTEIEHNSFLPYFYLHIIYPHLIRCWMITYLKQRRQITRELIS